MKVHMKSLCFSLGEADRHCKSMNDIPLVVLAAGKKAFYSQAAQLKWLQLQKNYYNYPVKVNL